MITNEDQIKDLNKIKIIKSKNEEIIPENVSLLNENINLVVLTLNGTIGEVLRLSNKSPDQQTKVALIGRKNNLDYTYKLGLVKKVDKNKNIIKTSISSNIDLAGGPIVDYSGCVLGINLTQTEDSYGMNFSFHSKSIRESIVKHKETNRKKSETNIALNNSEIISLEESETNDNKFYSDREEKSSYSEKESFDTLNNYLDKLEDLSDEDGKERESIKLANKILSLEKNERAYFLRGNAKSNLGKEESAIYDYNKAINIDPSNPSYYNYRGNSKYHLKNYSGSITDYTKAINLDPDNPIYISNRGNSKYKLKDYKGAIIDYNRAIKFDSSDPSYFNYRGNSKYYLKNYSGSIIDYTKAINLEPDKSMYISNRGNAKESINNMRGACNDWRKASKLGDKDAKGYVRDEC